MARSKGKNSETKLKKNTGQEFKEWLKNSQASGEKLTVEFFGGVNGREAAKVFLEGATFYAEPQRASKEELQTYIMKNYKSMKAAILAKSDPDNNESTMPSFTGPIKPKE